VNVAPIEQKTSADAPGPKGSYIGRNNATAVGAKRVQTNGPNITADAQTKNAKASAGSGKAAAAPEDEKHAEGTKLGHYILGKSLGKGTFGKVKMATHELTLESVAIKILEKARIKDRKDIERISREIKILKKVRHPNVI
jgi:serine/threonine protein kinase